MPDLECCNAHTRVELQVENISCYNNLLVNEVDLEHLHYMSKSIVCGGHALKDINLAHTNPQRYTVPSWERRRASQRYESLKMQNMPFVRKLAVQCTSHF